ncbi:TSUP family transporter [Phenylobacterium sp.]|uniref:TSUP family transporter n=1 Tax=Phenylobacterium sp. TaxID=1871053 RepID=UPI0011FB845B|nr:TSUP family transporter [Phenylobacterium sp.]THD59519.1 MAG: sulfite exporter TauE/SafE family protein [Phenylobacterium sp.]
MTLLTGGFIVAMSFVTAAISGVFGMAGGLMLKGALALVLPVSATFVVHGLLQLVANGWRAILHRQFVSWRIVAIYALGAFTAAALIGLIVYEPTRATLYLLMGLVPGLVWLPQGWVKVDASRPVQAYVCGLGVTGMNLTAGVAGPLLDVFFVRTALTRHQIVATKAATQVFSHLMKVVVYGAPLVAAGGKGIPPWWVFALAVPLSMLGTAAGGILLNRLSDVDFKRYLRLILTVIGAVYLVQAARLYLG